MHSARLNHYKINKNETRLLYITFLLKFADVVNSPLMGLIKRLTENKTSCKIPAC